ncbi:LOW QUALITY PROTEIN: hypothetical protein V1477_002690 [Vespula maculifrons]|uniref:Uncharacterized protein n=1 Tax=Vespula maculifrons TaxID=7453 RepID=A0ABD2CWS8_VESMC
MPNLKFISTIRKAKKFLQNNIIATISITSAKYNNMSLLSYIPPTHHKYFRTLCMKPNED